MGFQTPTEVQQQTIPVILSSRDLIACAQTGTGKTAAYMLPVMDRIVSMRNNSDEIKALVLVPTRELAIQIDQNIQGLAYFAPVSSIAIYGGGDGQSFEVQKKALMKGTDIVIATPGRLIAMLTSFQANFGKLKFLVLDEADRMLDMGFYDDIMRILRYVPSDRQTLMFSATMPPKIRKLASGLMRQPVEVNLSISKPAGRVEQRFYAVQEGDKLQLLQQLLLEQSYESILLFASTKQKVKALENIVKKINLHAQSFHSDLTQEQRDKAMLAFRNRQIPVIIGTDILSRGIDVEGIDLVVNFDVPPDPEDYIHRIGRTARADAKGTAITFVNPEDSKKFFRIEQLLGNEIVLSTIPESVGESPQIQKSAPRMPGGRNRAGSSNRYNKKNR